ncbi:g6324 [Coccomyxa viridis]|uniref:G6324 protein n=1 Tax=Coccomyxa viridis TaxID=1274662 RepID=A0ABP1FV42_9CHLO
MQAEEATGTIDDKGKSTQERLGDRLNAIEREVTAVNAALEGFDLDAEAEDSEDGQEEVADEQRELPADVRLQRAGLEQRLADLQAKQRQLQDALARERDSAALPAKGPAPEQPLQLQEDDRFLDEELDNTRNSAMVETERDRLIRLGLLTPFDRLEGFERRVHQPEATAEASAPGRAGQQPVEEHFQKIAAQMADIEATKPRAQLLDHAQLPQRERSAPKVAEQFWRQAATRKDRAPLKRRPHTLGRSKRKSLPSILTRKRIKKATATADGEPIEDAANELEDSDAEDEGDASFIQSDEDELSGSQSAEDADLEDALGEWDDAEEELYLARLSQWESRQHLLNVADIVPGQAPGASAPAAGGGNRAGAADGSADVLAEVTFDGGFRLPGSIYNRLFDYQKTGTQPPRLLCMAGDLHRMALTLLLQSRIKWMWELHNQRAGGIIGDEMGLGKTVQVAAFLAGLHHSGLFRPSIVVCPATVLRQWLRELRLWWPPFRVVVLHESQRAGLAPRPSRKELIRLISQSKSGILLTSYDQLRIQRAELLSINWGYAILDEGHKIRNPDAEITLVAKQLATVHRIIMSGSPIQNHLTELWSLFDFVFPGKLGTLPVFRASFALPIQFGGYANASAVQVSTAFKCAVVLRDLIAPYLLRRRKADVAQQLPKKTEQVLFCSLTGEQRDLYRAYLSSEEVQDILNDRKNALAGIDILRKICNHPDLLQRKQWESVKQYGDPVRSGKHIVAMKVLAHWKQQGHKALVFTQTQQMLDIMDRAVQALGYRYHRMDGSTNVAVRARLVDDFNSNDSVFLFLLTTKVGGLGINLTGADRVMLYDPDWNPSTDMQARERAWRIGQRREVTVYRLITSGTIEEKVYHRQIYKQFLTEKVLRDPKQKRFFKSKDIHDLFTLGPQYAGASETASIFSSLHGGLEVPLDPDAMAVPAESAQPTPAGGTSTEVSAEAAAQAGSSSEEEAAAPAGVRSANKAQRSRRSSAAGTAQPQSSSAPATLSTALAQSQEAPGDMDDAKILRDLFDGTGVMSALDHSKIEGANNPEALNIDAQAARIARKAAEALKRSRQVCQAAPVNQPTWTGRSGLSGSANGAQTQRFGATTNWRMAAQNSTAAEPNGSSAPSQSNESSSSAVRFGGGLAGTAGSTAPRSAVLLAQMRSRQAAIHAAASSAARNDPEVDEAAELTERIIGFLETCMGQADSQAVIEHFSQHLTARQAPLFRQLLQQVAKLQRNAAGSKCWTLRPDFVAQR